MKLKNNLYRLSSSNPSLGTDGKAEVFIELLPDSVIYKAHFPEQPITPGVCVAQIAVELAGLLLDCSLSLRVIKNCKFLSVMTPSQPVVLYSLECLPCEDGCVAVKAVAKNADTVLAKMSMICAKNGDV